MKNHIDRLRQQSTTVINYDEVYLARQT